MILDFYNKPKKYYEGYESFCYQHCLMLLLDSKNVTNAPLYINSSLSLVMTIGDTIDKYVFSGHKHTRTLVPEYADNVKRHYYDLCSNPVEIFEKNLEYITKQRKPIIVGADIFYLPYTPYYKKMHSTHTFILCGYCKENESVYITDWYDQWFYNGTVEKEAFLRSRNSDSPYDGSFYSGTPVLNNWVEIIDTQSMDKTPLELLKIILELSMKQYFRESDSQLIGVYAIQALKRNIESIYSNPTICTTELFKSLHSKLFVSLKRHKLFRQYLVNSNSIINNTEISVLVVDLTTIIGIWDIILMLMLKSSKVISYKTISKTINYLNDVIEKEKLIGERLSNLLEIL